MKYVEKPATDVHSGDLFIGAWAGEVFIPSTPARYVREVGSWEDASVVLNHEGDDGATTILAPDDIALVAVR